MASPYSDTRQNTRTLGGVGYNDGPQVAVKQAPPPTHNPSCFGNIEDVCGLTDTAAVRVEHIVDRLCGSVPQSAETGSPIGSPALFDAAEQHASAMRHNMQRIFSAIDRLEKSLP